MTLKRGLFFCFFASAGHPERRKLQNTRDFAHRYRGYLCFGGLLALYHGERDLLAVAIDLLDPHLDRVTDAHHVAGVLDKAVGQLGDMHEAVLVHSHVDEGAKVHNVAHRALELHAGLQVVDGKR